jgi:hypothetical protein
VTGRPLGRAAAVVLAVLMLVACGKRDVPVPPYRRLPEAVKDLSARAREGTVDLGWTLPRKRIDGSRLFDLGVARVYRLEDDGRGEPRAAMRVGDRVAGYDEIATIDLQEPASAAARTGRVEYTDRSQFRPGRRYTYVVLTTDAQGRVSPPSTRASLVYLVPPEAPGAVRADPGDGQVELTWQTPARLTDGSTVSGTLTYEVLRAPDTATTPAVVGQTKAGQTTFVDRGLTNDRAYLYSVRAVRSEGAATARGAPSAPVAVTPVKTTPPAPPTDLVAVPSTGEVRLSWTPSPSPDVGAYVVYRAAGGGAPERVGSVQPPAVTFVDRDVAPGRYRYTVTAQDRSTRANESTRSNEATVTVP